MRVAVIFTGGTIGSTLDGEWVSLNSVSKHLLISNYLNKFGDEVEFEIFTPFSILSENLSGHELSKLIKCVDACLKKNYDGIIVTHGTDTIQYTAAALCYTLEVTNIPVLFVSANYPLDAEMTNGNINFEAAVSFIKSRSGCGVFVSYKNTSKSAVEFHYGTRLLSHLETIDDLYSIDRGAFAFYEDGKICFNSEFKPVKTKKIYKNFNFGDKSDILVVSSHPGDSFEYNIEKFKAVILIPYHSSTLNTASAAFVDFCKRAKEGNIPVFVVNLRSEFIYESSKVFDELHLIKLPLCCFAAAYVKLWIALSSGCDVITFMNEEICGEFLDV